MTKSHTLVYHYCYAILTIPNESNNNEKEAHNFMPGTVKGKKIQSKLPTLYFSMRIDKNRPINRHVYLGC